MSFFTEILRAHTVLTHCPDPANLARQAATDWLEQLRLHSLKAGNLTYNVALSGGRITRTFFTEIVRQMGVNQAAPGGAFARVHFFWADERCVPPTDPESNYAMAKELLFGPLKVPDGQVHRLRGEGPELQALQQAVGEICQAAPVTRGQPVLDLVFLGMGEDGHVASLFPGEAEDAMTNPAVYRAVTAVKPPPRRITLGYGAIAAALDVWVLVSGKGKEAALKESLSLTGKTPLARVLSQRTRTRIYSDVEPAKR